MEAREKAEKILAKLPPAPAGVEKWIRERAVEKAYLIFSKKEDRVVCTRCGHEASMKRHRKAEHNMPCVCPRCKTEATYKASHHGRKRLTERFRILLFVHRGKTVYGTLWEIDADFQEFGKARIGRWLSALYEFTETERTYLKRHPGGCFHGDYWEEPKEVKLPCPPRGFNWGTMSKYERTEIYEDNLEAVFTNSCLRHHHDAEFFKKHGFNAYAYVRYIDQCLRHQAMELLRKAGHENLVLDRLRGGTRSLNMRGKSLEKILRLPKRWRKKARDLDMDSVTLEIFQRLGEKEKGEATPQLLEAMRDEERYRKEIERHLPFMAAAKYVAGRGGHLWMYRDYLRMADDLGWDLARKKILFPENLREAHDEATRLLAEQRDRANTEKMRRRIDEAKGAFPEFRKNGLLVRLAESQEELNEESKALAHCVRSYGDRVAEGRCLVFFIRREEKPGEPFYTLELDPKGEMVQCRGAHNRGMTEEVEAFVEVWIRQTKKTKPKNEREAA